MDTERAQHITSPIETNSIDERKNLLDKKLDLISLFYANKKYQEVKDVKTEYTFHEALKDYTMIVGRIKRILFGLEGFIFAQHREELDSFFKSFFEQLDSLYEEEGFNLEKILKLIEVAKSSIKQYLGVEDLKRIEPREVDERKHEHELVYFEDIASIGGSEEGRWSGLKKIGFSKFSKLTEVHIHDFYRTDEDRIGLESLRSYFEKIALHIVDESPDTAVVVGASWLLSTPIARKMGFIKIPGEDDSDEEKVKRGERTRKENDPSTWMQFIDKDGQINRKRFDKFCETGEIPFKSVKAYIPVEEFLRRYLPAPRRGEVVLKVLREDHEVIEDEMNKIGNTFKQDWNNLLKDFAKHEAGTEGVELPQSFIDNPNTQKFLDLLEHADREIVISFLREMYSKKISGKEFDKYKVGKYEIMNGLGMKISNRKYVEKKVVIE